MSCKQHLLELVWHMSVQLLPIDYKELTKVILSDLPKNAMHATGWAVRSLMRASSMSGSTTMSPQPLVCSSFQGHEGTGRTTPSTPEGFIKLVWDLCPSSVT